MRKWKSERERESESGVWERKEGKVERGCRVSVIVFVNIIIDKIIM